jgi:hypothetical protein
MLDAWEDTRLEPEEFRELEGERVPVLIRHRGRGKASGLEVGQVHSKGANLFELRDGRVVRLTVFLGLERALADLGLGHA